LIHFYKRKISDIQTVLEWRRRKNRKN